MACGRHVMAIFHLSLSLSLSLLISTSGNPCKSCTRICAYKMRQPVLPSTTTLLRPDLTTS